MCGICGIYKSSGAPVDRDILTSMTEIMRHRGPDGSGTYFGEGIGLGHRRLSIIDLGGGAQPISNEDDTLWVIFNGEIYNFIELRQELEQKGHRFKTKSDTEVILHGYEEWGKACVNRFNGIFAFAIWDCKEKGLFIARDHLGVKPLYYIALRDKLLFASEIKSLLRDRDCPREVDLKSLGELFTFWYVPSPNTMFKDIKKLSPGHWLYCKNGNVETKRFWSWTPQISNGRKESQLIEEYQYLLEDAIRLQLRSDVPVGLFLSSGIDSSTILAIMRKHLQGTIHTFTVGFEHGEATNETSDARRISEMFGTEHMEMDITAGDYEKYFDRYFWDIEEPLGDETAAAFYFVSKLASEKVKVVLTGQGADEPWAGYHRYIGVSLSTLYSKLPKTLTQFAKRGASSFVKNERLKRGMAALDEQDVLTRFTKIYSFFSTDMKERLFQDWVKKQTCIREEDVKAALAHLFNDVEGLDPLAQMLYMDTRASLPDDLLMVNDKTSMTNSIEARVPFLDYRLVEFIETIPSSLKLKGLQQKYLHKRAVNKWIPKEIINRKKKGFDNPVDIWLRGKLQTYMEEALLSENAALNKYFNNNYIKEIFAAHTANEEEYMRHINLLISFELWHRTFIH